MKVQYFLSNLNCFDAIKILRLENDRELNTEKHFQIIGELKTCIINQI